VSGRERTIKLWWLIAAFLFGLAAAMVAEDLILDWKGQRLEFSAPRVHFLAGRPLERLRNAAPVPFDFQITLWAGDRNHVYRRSAERFVVSYDLWEESFAVTRMQAPRKSASHLSSLAAEAWCLEQMSMDVSGLPESEPFWARLEIRAEDLKEPAPLFGRGRVDESGINLMASLIDIFSRPPQGAQSHWSMDAGPLTLDQLRQSRGHRL
jgi:hypothetical protein